MERSGTRTFDASATETPTQTRSQRDGEGTQRTVKRCLGTERCADTSSCSGPVADAQEDTT